MTEKNNLNIYKYSDYKEYKDSQIQGNHKKLNSSWVKPKDINFICDYIKKNDIIYNNIICHGTRQGFEQKYFLEYLNGIEYIIGTEISDTAIKFEHTIEHDFHEIKEEWIDKFDIVYTNSWDHSYDPNKSLNSWIESLKVGGYLFIEWNTNNLNKPGVTDPFSSTKDDYLNIFKNNNKILLIETISIISEMSIKPTSKEKVGRKIEKFYYVLKKIN